MLVIVQPCAMYSDHTNLVRHRAPTVATHLSRSQEFKKLCFKYQNQPKRICVGGGIFGEIPNENIPWTYK